MFTPIEFVLVSVLVVGNPTTGKLKLLYEPMDHYKTIKELLNINFIVNIEGTKTKLNYIKGTPCLPNIIKNLKNRK